MKVLLLFQHLRYEDERGGQRSRELAEYLVAHDIEVTALIPNVDPLTSKKAIPGLVSPWRFYRACGGYEEYRYYVPPTARRGLPGRFLYGIFCFFNSLLFLSFYGRKYDVVVTTTHPLPMAIATLPIKWLGATKLIIEVRDIPLDVAVERKLVSRNGFFSKCYRFLEGSLLRNADHVVSYSQQMLELLSKRYMIKASSLVPIGVGQIDEMVEKSVRGGHADVRICFFGTLGKVLSLAGMFDLVQILKDKGLPVKLDIFGDGESKSELIGKSRLLNLNVEFHDVIPKNEVVKKCSEYDFAIYPVEGGKAVAASLGNKFFDYLAARTPIVVLGKDSEAGRIVKECGVGLVSQDELSVLADDIIECVNKAVKARQRTNSLFSFETAISDYSKRNLYQRFYNVIQGLAG